MLGLSETEIRRRLVALRNKTKLHAQARARIEALEEENKELKEKAGELREENEKLRQQAEEARKRLEEQLDANKKLRDLLFAKQSEKPRTRRPKERVHRTAKSYQRPAPERITDRRELLLAECPHCEGAVGSPLSSYTRIVEDIVFTPAPEVVEWTIHRHWCAQCRQQVTGRVPGVLPKTRIGPNTLTLVVVARYRWNQPYDKIQDQLAICFGLRISQGEITALIARAVALAGEKWAEIEQAVKAGRAVHCDETGWYIDGEKAWAHAFATESAVLYEIVPSRGKGVAERMLKDYDGVRVTDCLPNYKRLSGTHQVCWAHLTREAGENAHRAPEDSERQLLSQELDVIYAALRNAAFREPWDAQYAERVHSRVRKRLDMLHERVWRDSASRRLINRLAEFDHALFTCLTRGGIPPDNNHAERVLRKIVVQRKISGGSRSGAHAAHHAKLMSVMETLRLEDKPLLENLQSVFREGVAARLSGG